MRIPRKNTTLFFPFKYKEKEKQIIGRYVARSYYGYIGMMALLWGIVAEMKNNRVKNANFLAKQNQSQKKGRFLNPCTVITFDYVSS